MPTIHLGRFKPVTADRLTPEYIKSLDLSGVEEPHIRDIIRDIIGNKAFKDAVNFPSKAVLECDRNRVIKIANTLASEIRPLTALYNPGIIGVISYMAELLVPTDNYGLALAISRAWVVAVCLDDYCETSRTRWLEFLDHFANPNSESPIAKYMHFAIDAVKPFSSQSFVNVWKQALHKGLLGGFLECEVAMVYPQGGCRSSKYFRQMSGYADFWGLTLSLLHPELSFPENPKVWTDILSDISTFLCDYNDAMSVYKEAKDGAEFVKNVIYQEGYKEAFPTAVNNALSSAEYILNVVPPATRDIFERFLRGYGYFHIYSR
ncbi:uncharacterized protein VTP21DRAFT_9249 [Calcarisporiella thermophila]|uniref:uncharacterized protein n=1 Tax=Calcarisporiella thermophila TaxID=911321 RepID=UPI003742AA22